MYQSEGRHGDLRTEGESRSCNSMGLEGEYTSLEKR